MKTKEEVIKEAWGEHYTERVDENGWCSIWGTSLDLKECDIVKEYQDSSGDICRPKTLRGIENNNGWIHIESEADLPNENEIYHVFYSDGTISSRYFHQKHNDWTNDPKATHYQPIVKPNKPLY